jgi:anti-sigma B factor antagonist
MHEGSVREFWVAVSVDDASDSTVIGLTGELDLASSPELSCCLRQLAASGRHLVVDLGRLRFIDASGLRVLMEARGIALAQGRTLTLRRPRENVARVLSLAGLGTLFAIES